MNSTTSLDLIPRLLSINPILAVPDVSAVIHHYRDVLGFANVWMWGDPPSYGGADMDGVGVHFTLDPTLAQTAEGRAVWMRVHNLAALYSRHQEQGAAILEPLEAKPWGVTEYTVRDMNGYRLRFTGSVSASNQTSLPEDFRIEVRSPTWAEMERLIHAVGWASFTNLEIASRVLEAARFGVVAFIREEVIGSALVTSDNAFYYLRDVMVAPEWQRRGVGTALVRKLMEQVFHHVPPHTLVGLYTGSNLHDFYARFGFRGPANGLYGMTQTIE